VDMVRIHALGLFSITALWSCSTAATRQRLPEPVDAGSSALAVSVFIQPRTGPFLGTGKAPDIVLFARLEEGEDLDDLKTKDVLIPSTFVSGRDAYVLNVDPGSYVAVAAVYSEDLEPLHIPIGNVNVGKNVQVKFHLGLFDGTVTSRDYFSRELIEQTQTSVAPASFAFMGRYIGEPSLRFGRGDELQEHFLRVLEGQDTRREAVLDDLDAPDAAHRLSATVADRGLKADYDFCGRAAGVLRGTAWALMLERLKQGDSSPSL